MSSLQSPSAGFEHATAGIERPQTYDLGRMATIFGIGHSWCSYILVWMCYVSFLSIWPSIWETLLPTIILAFVSFQPHFCLLTRRLDIQTFTHIHISAHLFQCLLVPFIFLPINHIFRVWYISGTANVWCYGCDILYCFSSMFHLNVKNYTQIRSWQKPESSKR